MLCVFRWHSYPRSRSILFEHVVEGSNRMQAMRRVLMALGLLFVLIMIVAFATSLGPNGPRSGAEKNPPPRDAMIDKLAAIAQTNEKKLAEESKAYLVANGWKPQDLPAQEIIRLADEMKSRNKA